MVGKRRSRDLRNGCIFYLAYRGAGGSGGGIGGGGEESLPWLKSSGRFRACPSSYADGMANGL